MLTQIIRDNVEAHAQNGYPTEAAPYQWALTQPVGLYDCTTGAPARLIADPPFMKSHPLGALLAGLAFGLAIGMTLGAASKHCPAPPAAYNPAK